MGTALIHDLLLNFRDFKAAGDDELRKGRYNPAISSYFKALVILCDIKIYSERQQLPKNHSERFIILENHFPEAYSLLSPLFDKYRDSYNLRMQKKDVMELLENVKRLKKIFKIEE